MSKFQVNDFVVSQIDGDYHYGYIKEIQPTSAGDMYSITYHLDRNGFMIPPISNYTFEECISDACNFIKNEIIKKQCELKNLQDILDEELNNED